MNVILARVLITFIIMAVSIWITQRRDKNSQGARIRIICCALTVISAVISWNITEAIPLPTEQVQITALRQKNARATRNELYLTGVYVDEEKIELKTATEDKWFWQSNLYVWRDETDTRRPVELSDSFALEIPMGTGRRIEFLTNHAKGMVEVEYAGEAQILDCFSEEDGYISARVPDTAPSETRLYEGLMLGVFTALCTGLCLILMIIFFAAAKKMSDTEWLESSLSKHWSTLFFLICAVGTFWLLQNVYPSTEHFYFDHFICTGMALDENLRSVLIHYTSASSLEAPLSVTINYFYYKIMPFGEQWLFLLPNIFITASVFFIGKLVSKFTNTVTGMAAVALAIASATLLEYGKDTRGYSLIVPIVLFLVYSYANIRFNGNNIKNRLLFAISMALTAYCSYHATVLLFGIFIFDMLWQHKRFSLKLLSPYFIAGLLYSPWLILVGIKLIHRVSEFRETSTWHLSLDADFLNTLLYQLSGQNCLLIWLTLCSVFILVYRIVSGQALEKKYFIWTVSAYLTCFYCVVRIGWAFINPDNTLLQYRYFSHLIPLVILAQCALPQLILDYVSTSQEKHLSPYCAFLFCAVSIGFIMCSTCTIVGNQNGSNSWLKSPEWIITSKEVNYQTSCVYVGGTVHSEEKKQMVEYLMYQKNKRCPVNCVAASQILEDNIYLLSDYSKIFCFDSSEAEQLLIQEQGFKIVDQYSKVVVFEKV